MTIKLTCNNCHKIYDVEKTEEIPVNAVALGCNFCTNCETSATEPYREWVKRTKRKTVKNLTIWE